jgi:uncharacterized protein
VHLLNGKPVFSAGDLVGFLACEHLTDLERAALAGMARRPERSDPEIELIRKRGYEHEARYKAELEVSGRQVTTIRPDTYDDQPDGRPMSHPDDLLEQVRLTRAAIERGDDVIFQAAFFDGEWRGHADFLLRVDGPSDLGPYHYEIADTKLARSTKAGALLQLCTYVDLLEKVQGIRPEYIYVALGGSQRPVDRQRVNDYYAYYQSIKRRFEATVTSTDRPVDYPPSASSPDPVEHCDVCRWINVCNGWWRDNDSLKLVAGISRSQRSALTERGYATRRGLAKVELPLVPRLAKGSPDAVRRVRDQARVQVRGEDERRPVHELLAPERMPDGTVVPGRGLAGLPAPAAGDLFFDIEGDPFAFEDGLEYLFGVVADGEYRHWWARDPAHEKEAFEKVVDFFIDRRRSAPDSHIYHYGAYERGRMARLSTRHATREDEVDQLLRGGAFVDLYSLVRQSLQASVESYSIKKLEPFYGYVREVELHAADQSIVEFERYLEDGGSDESILERIRLYNRDDCISTSRLRDWLEQRRSEAATKFGIDLPRRTDGSALPAEELADAIAEIDEIARALTADMPRSGPAADDQRNRQLLANLLDWHRREAKSTWWHFFDLMAKPDEELLEEREPIAGLEFVEQTPPAKRKKWPRFTYRFPPQENKVDVGSSVHDPRLMEVTKLGDAGSIDSIDQDAGLLTVSRNPALPHPTALVPFEFFRTESHRQALVDIGRWVVANDLDTRGPYQAARDLLARRRPRLLGQPAPAEASLAAADETGTQAALRLVTRLDHTTLPIQGPPGSGKSSTGARMVLELIDQGQRVGITANSHKVIYSMAQKVAQLAANRGQRLRILHRADDETDCIETDAIKRAKSPEQMLDVLDSAEPVVLAGTSWLWTNAKMRDSVDVLFVDEAGQLSLANALAVSVAAQSMVLLGDPQQLDQPIQGSHPDGAEKSALEHLLGDAQTIDSAHGLFLEHTWRLHPEICRFTSDAFYEGKLESREGLGQQQIEADPPLGGSGLRWLAVDHRGNTSESDEEAEVVAGLARRLAESGLDWIDLPDTGIPLRRPLTWADVLIVAPYNAQVGAIRERLPEAARGRVGTVDKFQGQQAAVAIYSMTTSSPEDAPHGMEFLYKLNRLNVATSRAKCLAIVVASPELIRVRCHTPHQMKLANALCRFIELATPMTDPRPPAAVPPSADGKPVQLSLVLS